MVASVLGAVGAGYRLRDVTFRESGQDITGAVELTLPGGPPPVERDLPEPSFQTSSRSPGAPIGSRPPDEVLRRAITEHAVAILQARGEPARYERLLGEVLLGLDRSGHLQRVTVDWAAEERRAAGLPPEHGDSRTGPRAHGRVRPGASRHPRARRRDADDPVDRRASSGGRRHGHLVPASDPIVARPRSTVRGWSGPPVLSPNTEPATTGYWIPRGLLDEPEALPSADAWAAPPAFEATPPIRATPHLTSLRPMTPGSLARMCSRAGPGAALAATGDRRRARRARRDGDGRRRRRMARRPGPARPRPRSCPASRPPIGTTSPTRSGPCSTQSRRSSIASDHPHLVEVEPGRWWLRDAARHARRPRRRSPTASSGPCSRCCPPAAGIPAAAFNDRIASMFRGHDTPDEELIRACVDSYRGDHPRLGRAAPGAGHPPGPVSGSTASSWPGSPSWGIGWACASGSRPASSAGCTRAGQRASCSRRPSSGSTCRSSRPGPVEALEQIDCIWYLRGKATFLFEVEWTAMLGEPCSGAARPSRRVIPSCGSWSSQRRGRSSSGSSWLGRRCCGSGSSRTTGTSSRRSTCARLVARGDPDPRRPWPAAGPRPGRRVDWASSCRCSATPPEER